jgi:hypothetical protein
MHPLPSGLPEQVGNAEDISRFLPQSNLFNTFGAKPAAFLPNPKYRNTSVFRLGNDPDRLRQTWTENDKSGRLVKGAAICKVNEVRAVGLDVIAEEPPPAHANIEGWPWMANDPEVQKAQQLELAGRIAESSEFIRL